LRITSVGVIGLGSTGRTVARRLLDNGFEVTVHDRDAWTVATMVEAGARPARIPADAAEPADLVFVHVPDEAAAEDVLFDCGGVGETLRDGGFVVTSSRTDSAFVRSAADRLGALGLKTVEAWFTGDAGSTATTAFVGCSPQDLATVAPALEAVADNVTHIGPLGSVCTLRTAVAALYALQPFAPEGGRNASRVDLEEALAGRVGDESRRAAPDGHSADRRTQSTAALARALVGALVDGRARPNQRQHGGSRHGPCTAPGVPTGVLTIKELMDVVDTVCARHDAPRQASRMTAAESRHEANCLGLASSEFEDVITELERSCGIPLRREAVQCSTPVQLVALVNRQVTSGV
jgi:hypothetical protein